MGSEAFGRIGKKSPNAARNRTWNPQQTRLYYWATGTGDIGSTCPWLSTHLNVSCFFLLFFFGLIHNHDSNFALVKKVIMRNLCSCVCAPVRLLVDGLNAVTSARKANRENRTSRSVERRSSFSATACVPLSYAWSKRRKIEKVVCSWQY